MLINQEKYNELFEECQSRLGKYGIQVRGEWHENRWYDPCRIGWYTIFEGKEYASAFLFKERKYVLTGESIKVPNFTFEMTCDDADLEQQLNQMAAQHQHDEPSGKFVATDSDKELVQFAKWLDRAEELAKRRNERLTVQ